MPSSSLDPPVVAGVEPSGIRGAALAVESVPGRHNLAAGEELHGGIPVAGPGARVVRDELGEPVGKREGDEGKGRGSG